MHVAICALTLHRPAGLRALLDALAALDQPAAAELEVIIVDNDANRSAEPIVTTAALAMPFPLRYVVEPRRGIAEGRNRAVTVALDGGADVVAFIDDDEVPSPSWLVELLRVQAVSGADVVTGPVRPVFDQPPPRWAVAGSFFERPRFATGTSLTYARTSNVLVSSTLLREPWPPFDERFGRSGGEDTHFFMRARLAGARIVWADEAVVDELVPASRVSAGWLVRRAYRRGNTLSLCLRDLRDSWPNRGRRVVRAGVEVLLGSARLVASVLGGRRFAIAGASQVAYGLGLASGLVGIRYEEYRTTHGG